MQSRRLSGRVLHRGGCRRTAYSGRERCAHADVAGDTPISDAQGTRSSGARRYELCGCRRGSCDSGVCLCALEKARREGRTEFFKPISCALYPARIKEYDGFTAVNYHRWKICKGAEVMGRVKGVRAYEFLREPLVRRFGREWYDELCLTAREYLRQFPESGEKR